MSGLDEMLKAIRGAAEAEANALLEAARLEAGRAAGEVREVADAECARIAEQARAEAEAIRARAEAEAQIAHRRAVLAEKQKLLGDLLEGARSELQSLPAERYFPLLISMAARNAELGEGVMLLCAEDLARMPGDFAKRLAEALPAGARLSVSDAPHESGGGFILQYGNIDRNCSFPALFAEKREALTDAAARVLFG